MNCDKFSELLLDYLDGTLSNEEKMQVDMHLQSCVACKEEMELIRENMNFLHDLPMVELPDGYHEELMAKLSSEGQVIPITAHKAKKPANRWKQYSLVAAAALIIVASGGINGILSNREPIDQMVRDTSADGVVAETPLDEAEDAKVGAESQRNEMSTPANDMADAGVIENKPATVNSNARQMDSAIAPMIEPRGVAPQPYVSNDSILNDTYDVDGIAVTQENAEPAMPYQVIVAEVAITEDMEISEEATIEESVAMGAYDAGAGSLMRSDAVVMKNVVSEETVASAGQNNAWETDIETQKNNAIMNRINEVGGSAVFTASDGAKTTAIIPSDQLDALIDALKDVATVKTVETNLDEITIEITLK